MEKNILVKKKRYSAIIQYIKKMLKSKSNQRIINSIFKVFLKYQKTMMEKMF